MDDPLALAGLQTMGFSMLHSFEEIYSQADDWRIA
jgi:hypothetical protein